MTDLSDLHNKVAETIRGDGLDIEVYCTTYKGTNHPVAGRKDKVIRILTCIDGNGDPFSVLIGEKTRGPALFRTAGDDFKKLVVQANISLKNAGYPPKNNVTTTNKFLNAGDLWDGVFRKDHHDNRNAVLAFLRLVGIDIDDAGAFEAAAEKAGIKLKPKDAPPANPYGDNPLWGAL